LKHSDIKKHFANAQHLLFQFAFVAGLLAAASALALYFYEEVQRSEAHKAYEHSREVALQLGDCLDKHLSETGRDKLVDVAMRRDRQSDEVVRLALYVVARACPAVANQVEEQRVADVNFKNWLSSAVHDAPIVANRIAEIRANQESAERSRQAALQDEQLQAEIQRRGDESYLVR